MLDAEAPAGSSRSRGATGTRDALVGWLRGGEQDMEQPLLKALCTVFSLFCLVKSQWYCCDHGLLLLL